MVYYQFRAASLAVLVFTLSYSACVCSPISNDASLYVGVLEQGNAKVFGESVIATGSDHSTSAAGTKVMDEVNTAVKISNHPVGNQLSFVLRLMGQVVAAIRAVLESTTRQTARTHVNTAIARLDELMRHAERLIGTFPTADQSVARRTIDFWIDAITVVRETLVGFVAAARDLAGIKAAAQRVLNQLGGHFWTRAAGALNAYVAANEFTTAWKPWSESIRAFMDSSHVNVEIEA
ncbi:hypothetical protein FGB62_137g14 [Gracilaria domingensis]|nr:hypothetical protein FGB62_137g14 [Gracilaria domingensis]